MCEVSQGACEAVVGGVVGGIRDGVASDHGGGAVGGIGRVVDKVHFAQQSLLMVLEFAHHFGGVQELWILCDRMDVAEVCGRGAFSSAGASLFRYSAR